jgi:hypothetical protein
MPESGGDPPIIITGGSVTVEFDVSQLVSAGIGKFSNDQKVIKRVQITGTGIPNYDQFTTGNNVTVTVTYGNP